MIKGTIPSVPPFSLWIQNSVGVVELYSSSSTLDRPVDHRGHPSNQPTNQPTQPTNQYLPTTQHENHILAHLISPFSIDLFDLGQQRRGRVSCTI